mgnify:FL=1
MRKLYLLRHAKSSYEDGLPDFERRLAPRGIADIKALSPHLFRILPDDLTMYCSLAKRTQQTLQYYLDYADMKWTNVNYKNSLYTFNGRDLEKVIRSFKDDGNDALVVGHNEALTEFVQKFDSNFTEHIPTSGFLELELDKDSWAEFTKVKVTLKLFPKDIR